MFHVNDGANRMATEQQVPLTNYNRVELFNDSSQCTQPNEVPLSVLDILQNTCRHVVTDVELCAYAHDTTTTLAASALLCRGHPLFYRWPVDQQAPAWSQVAAVNYACMMRLSYTLTPNATKNSTAPNRNAKTNENGRLEFRFSHPPREEAASAASTEFFGRTGGDGDTTHGRFPLLTEAC